MIWNELQCPCSWWWSNISPSATLTHWCVFNHFWTTVEAQRTKIYQAEFPGSDLTETETNRKTLSCWLKVSALLSSRNTELSHCPRMRTSICKSASWYQRSGCKLSFTVITLTAVGGSHRNLCHRGSENWFIIYTYIQGTDLFSVNLQSRRNRPLTERLIPLKSFIHAHTRSTAQFVKHQSWNLRYMCQHRWHACWFDWKRCSYFMHVDLAANES